MSDTIEQLIRNAVKSALRDSMDQIRPALAAAIREALNGNQSEARPATYVLVKDAARLMSAHPSTVRKLIADGKLGRYSLEGQLRVKLSDVHAYLAREGQPSPTLNLDERALEILRCRDE